MIKNENINIPDPVMRFQVADYLSMPDGTYELMGIGFESLNESPNAQSSGKTYINQKAQASFIKSYQTEFPFSADMIVSEKAIDALYEVGRDHLTGAEAMFEYVRVDLFRPIMETAGSEQKPSTKEFKARRFIVSCEVSGNEGAGGEPMTVAGTLKAFGDPTFGTFDITGMKFNPSAVSDETE